MKELILIGGGGHCTSCIDVIESVGHFIIKGILDLPEKLGSEILGYQIFGTDQDLPKMVTNDIFFLITIGQIKDPQPRIRIYNELKRQSARLATIVSPNAYVSQHAKVGEGTIIMHGATVNANSIIGSNCIVNSHSLVEHDAKIMNHCHISTSAVVNGGVIVGEGSFLGSGAVTNQYISIPPFSFIPAHSLAK